MILCSAESVFCPLQESNHLPLVSLVNIVLLLLQYTTWKIVWLCSLKKSLNYPFALNVYSVLYCSLISCCFFLDALVARRPTLDRILSFHHCKLISWQVHLPEFWLKSINLIQMNFILKKKIHQFRASKYQSQKHTQLDRKSQLPSFYCNQAPHHTSVCTYKTAAVQMLCRCCADRERRSTLVSTFTYRDVDASVKLIIM